MGSSFRPILIGLSCQFQSADLHGATRSPGQNKGKENEQSTNRKKRVPSQKACLAGDVQPTGGSRGRRHRRSRRNGSLRRGSAF